jgi:hypothetical protein
MDKILDVRQREKNLSLQGTHSDMYLIFENNSQEAKTILKWLQEQEQNLFLKEPVSIIPLPKNDKMNIHATNDIYRQKVKDK